MKILTNLSVEELIHDLRCAQKLNSIVKGTKLEELSNKQLDHIRAEFKRRSIGVWNL